MYLTIKILKFRITLFLAPPVVQYLIDARVRPWLHVWDQGELSPWPPRGAPWVAPNVDMSQSLTREDPEPETPFLILLLFSLFQHYTIVNYS